MYYFDIKRFNGLYRISTDFNIEIKSYGNTQKKFLQSSSRIGVTLRI